MKTTLQKLTFGASLLPVLGLIASSVSAAPSNTKSASLVCPVTSLPIGSPSLAVGKSVYKGTTYYFCTSNCKRLFDKNPAKYARHKN